MSKIIRLKKGVEPRLYVSPSKVEKELRKNNFGGKGRYWGLTKDAFIIDQDTVKLKSNFASLFNWNMYQTGENDMVSINVSSHPLQLEGCNVGAFASTVNKDDIQTDPKKQEEIKFYAIDECGSHHFPFESAIDVYKIPKSFHEETLRYHEDNLEVFDIISKHFNIDNTIFLNKSDIEKLKEGKIYDLPYFKNWQEPMVSI